MKIALVTTDNRECFKRYSSPEPEFGAAPEALLQGFAALPGVEVHVVCCARKPLQAPAKLFPNIYYHSLLVPKIGWMSTGYQGCIRAVRRLLSSIQPDLVHGQGTERECAMAAAFSGYPNLVTIHGHMRHIARITGAKPFSFGWLAARFESLAVRRSGGVLCLSTYSQNIFAPINPRTWVIRNAARKRFFEIKRVPCSPRRILCVAHVHPWKNQNLLIQSLEGLSKEVDFRLRLFGQVTPDSDYGRTFLELVNRNSWCEYFGAADAQQIGEELSQAHALVLPSIEDNSPVAVLEAMAAGLPVAGAAIGGVPDLIQNGKTGWLFNPRDSAGIREAVKGLLGDGSGAIAATGQAYAREFFSPDYVAIRHLEVYRELLGK